MNPAVDRWIDEHRGEIVASLQKCVQVKSVESEPEPGAPFGREVKRCLAETLALADSFGFTARDMDGYIGYADFGAGAETLGVMCHLDVVPEGTGWSHPPYGAEIVDGKMFGRGTLDDKGPAIAVLYALAAVKACGIPLKRKIRVLLGCDEESGWGCMAHYKTHEKMPELAFSPDAEYPLVNSEKGIFRGSYKKEFTSGLKVDAGTRPNVVPGYATAVVPLNISRVLPVIDAYTCGSVFSCEVAERGEDACEIAVTGLSAHASMPEQGKNALLALLDVLSKLPLEGEDAATICALRELFKLETDGRSIGLEAADDSGSLTLNVAILRWDEKGISEMTLDIRAPISLAGEHILEKLDIGFARAGMARDSYAYTPGHYVDPESELVKKLLQVYADRAGEYLPPLKIGGGTYARAIKNAVAFGCERPGVESPVHMPNEFISIEDLMFNTKMMADAILALAAE
ncbi:MAG: Sapep family Mn(2+)-dependent dipeptidase [Clostridiaceae bacterium]